MGGTTIFTAALALLSKQGFSRLFFNRAVLGKGNLWYGGLSHQR